MRLLFSLLLLGLADGRSWAALSLEQPAGTSLTSGEHVYFGGMPFRYFEPVETVQAGDGTFTSTFAGFPRSPYSTYQIERSFDGESNWVPLFTPGLEPDLSGALTYHDPAPFFLAFYRLLVITDTQREFTIRNTGASNLNELEVVVLGENSGQFELNVNGLAETLAPGATTTFTVTYVSDDPEPRSAELQVNSLTGASFGVQLVGADQPPPSPRPELIEVVLTPAGSEPPAGIAGQVVDGPALGQVLLEASTDLGLMDVWEVIATIPLDEAGSASFGQPTPVLDPGSMGSPANFYRLRVN